MKPLQALDDWGAPHPTHASPERLRLGLRASAGADFASLPTPSPGAELAVVLLFGLNRVEILGSAWLPEPARAAALPATGAEISLVTAGARYCRALEPGRLEVAACAGLQAGAMLGRSFGITHPVSGSTPWITPELGLLGIWNASPSFAFTLALDGLLAGGRDPFALPGTTASYRPAPLTGRALVGLEARFR